MSHADTTASRRWASAALNSVLDAAGPSLRASLERRYARCGARLLQTLDELYGDQPQFGAWLTTLCRELGTLAGTRPEPLRAMDCRREDAPGWFIDAKLVGYCAYVDRFGGDLCGVTSRIGYLKELGVGYLHLLPFLRARNGDSDGGFAVADFDQVDPALGTMDDLEALTGALREAGISLCADLVLNHVADEHPWARAALRGDPEYRAFFHLFPDRSLPDRYEQSLGQVFPQAAPGNFSHVPALDGWVWTTFYPFQWDLNYANPAVFAAIATTLLRLANRGVEVFRLDSAPYLWKRLGTSCTNQPEVHLILRALRAIVDLVAPAVLLKAEAIVPAAELAPYFGEDAGRGHECHLAYDSGRMAAGWASLAEGTATLLRRQYDTAPDVPEHSGWMSYVRCHDDIVWSVLRPDVEATGGDFRTRIGEAAARLEGRRPGSFGHGMPFQTADGADLHGTNGMTAALVGLLPPEGAAVDAAAMRRFSLVYGLAFFSGAIPLIYMGDELAQPNNDAAADSARLVLDGRWLQRPWFDSCRAARRLADESTATFQSWASLARLVAARRHPAFDPHAMPKSIGPDHPTLLTLGRGEQLVAVFNLGSNEETFDWRSLQATDGWTTLLDTTGAPPTDRAGAVRLPPWSMSWRVRT